MNKDLEIKLKSISTRVRPPRYVVFVNSNDPHWMFACKHIIEWNSQMWGGHYNLIVPTDGDSIDDTYWEILDAYQPDFFMQYSKTIKDLEECDNKEYRRIEAINTEIFLKNNPGYIKKEAKKVVKDLIDASYSSIDNFEVKDELRNKLIQRCNPFHSSTYPEHAIEIIRMNGGIDNQATSVLSIKENEDKKIVDFELSEYPIDIELLIRSKVGSSKSAKWNLDNERKSFAREYDKSKTEFIYENVPLPESYYLFKKLDNTSEAPFSVAATGLSNFTLIGKDNYEKKLVLVIIGESINDFCLYYNLLRFGHNVHFIPSSIVDKFDKKKDDDGIAHLFHYMADDVYADCFKGSSSKSEIGIFSYSEKDRIKSIKDDFIKASFFGGEEVVIKILDNFKFSDVMPNPFKVYERAGANRTYLEQFQKNNSLNLLKTPKPESIGELNIMNHRWIVDMEILSDNPRNDKINGYNLPARSYFSNGIFQNVGFGYYDSEGVRFFKDGISFLCPNHGFISYSNTLDETLIRPRLHLLNSFEVFEKIFNEAGYSIKLSDKGNYAKNAIKSFDSLENLSADLLNDNFKKVFDCFINNTNGKGRKNKKIHGVCVSGRSYLSFEDIRELLDGDDLVADDIINKYINNGIFLKGFVLQCSQCKNSDWYPLEELGQDFSCHRCLKRILITKENWKKPHQPLLYYKLDENFYQGYDNDMTVPILTINTLSKKAEKSFMFINEIEVRKEFTDENPLIELDVVSMVDGNIIVGECKKNSKVPEKIKLYNEILNKIDGQFILSTTSDIIEESLIEKVNELKWNKEAMFLTKNELV